MQIRVAIAIVLAVLLTAFAVAMLIVIGTKPPPVGQVHPEQQNNAGEVIPIPNTGGSN